MDRISRRSLLASSIAPALVSGLRGSAQTTPSGFLVYVGTYTEKTSKGIYAFRFQSKTGELIPLGLMADVESHLPRPPANHRFLYAVNEEANYQGTHSGLVSGFAIDHLSGKLKPVNSVASGGSGPCHLAVDHTGSDLFVANYGSGSAASYHLKPNRRDWSVGIAISVFRAWGRSIEARRSTCHCTTVSPDNKYVLVNDLGLDRIVVYRLDPATAKLTPTILRTGKRNPVPVRDTLHSIPKRNSLTASLKWRPQWMFWVGTARQAPLLHLKHFGASGRLHGESTGAEIVGRPYGPLRVLVESRPQQHCNVRGGSIKRHLDFNWLRHDAWSRATQFYSRSQRPLGFSWQPKNRHHLDVSARRFHGQID